VSDSDQRKLTHDPKALPRVFELIAEARGLGEANRGNATGEVTAFEASSTVER